MLEGWNAHRQALAKAQAWCALKLDVAHPATSLRSAALESYIPDLAEDWQYVPNNISALIGQRRQLLGPIDEPPSQGRILCVLSDTDTQMGEGVPVSDGVMDGLYLPPWDGWFAIVPLRLFLCVLRTVFFCWPGFRHRWSDWCRWLPRFLRPRRSSGWTVNFRPDGLPRILTSTGRTPPGGNSRPKISS